MEHFLTKSAFRLSTPSALLASILSRAWLTMKSQGDGRVIMFWLAISIKDIFLESVEGFV